MGESRKQCILKRKEHRGEKYSWFGGTGEMALRMRRACQPRHKPSAAAFERPCKLVLRARLDYANRICMLAVGRSRLQCLPIPAGCLTYIPVVVFRFRWEIRGCWHTLWAFVNSTLWCDLVSNGTFMNFKSTKKYTLQFDEFYCFLKCFQCFLCTFLYFFNQTELIFFITVFVTLCIMKMSLICFLTKQRILF